MAKVLITEGYLSDIADAIREKKASEDTYTPAEMADVIMTIPTGTAPTGTININTNGTHDVTDYANANVSVPTGTARTSADLTASNLTVTAPAGLYAENATKTLSDQNLVAGNVKKDVTIFGTTGTYEGSGGDANENLRKMIDNTLSSYIDDSLTAINSTIGNGSNLTEFIAHNVTTINVAAWNGTSIEYLAFPNVSSANIAFCFRSPKLKGVDLAVNKFVSNYFASCSSLTTIVIRYSSGVVTLDNINAFNGSRFASGAAGGTIYIPKALYDHLGDGTSLDYKAAPNWSTIDGYGTITWACIEGSYYETHYIDGTTIPT